MRGMLIQVISYHIIQVSYKYPCDLKKRETFFNASSGKSDRLPECLHTVKSTVSPKSSRKRSPSDCLEVDCSDNFCSAEEYAARNILLGFKT